MNIEYWCKHYNKPCDEVETNVDSDICERCDDKIRVPYIEDDDFNIVFTNEIL